MASIPIHIDQIVYKPDPEAPEGKVKVTLLVAGHYLSALKGIADTQSGTIEGKTQPGLGFGELPHKTYRVDPDGDEPRLVENEQGADLAACFVCGLVRPEHEFDLAKDGEGVVRFVCRGGCGGENARLVENEQGDPAKPATACSECGLVRPENELGLVEDGEGVKRYVCQGGCGGENA